MVINQQNKYFFDDKFIISDHDNKNVATFGKLIEIQRSLAPHRSLESDRIGMFSYKVYLSYYLF